MQQNKGSQNQKRWHKPDLIRTLRQQAGLSQESFANQLSLYMQKHMPDVYHSSMALTQSMISDLELGRTNLSVPLLYTMAAFFEVDVEDLLLPELANHTPGQQALVGIQDVQEINEASDELAILFSFPSPIFGSGNTADLLDTKLDAKQSYTEVYTLDAFVNFLFSPVGDYSRAEKIHILEEVLSFFSTGIRRDLYFASYTDTCLGRHVSSMFKRGAKVFYLLPSKSNEPNQHAQSILFNGEALSGEVEDFYLNALKLINESMIFLHIAIHVLKAGRLDSVLAEIEAFYLECTKRSYDAEAVRLAFNPEIQNHLESFAKS